MLYKLKDLSLDPQYPHKRWGQWCSPIAPMLIKRRQLETWSSRASHPSWIHEVHIQWETLSEKYKTESNWMRYPGCPSLASHTRAGTYVCLCMETQLPTHLNIYHWHKCPCQNRKANTVMACLGQPMWFSWCLSLA